MDCYTNGMSSYRYQDIFRLQGSIGIRKGFGLMSHWVHYVQITGYIIVI
jgi:hypothetical protein